VKLAIEAKKLSRNSKETPEVFGFLHIPETVPTFRQNAEKLMSPPLPAQFQTGFGGFHQITASRLLFWRF